jgi:hypothetical protein
MSRLLNLSQGCNDTLGLNYFKMHAIMGRVSRRGIVKKWSKCYVYAKFGIEALMTPQDYQKQFPIHCLHYKYCEMMSLISLKLEESKH